MEQEERITFLQIRFLDGFVKDFSGEDAEDIYTALKAAEIHDRRNTVEVYSSVDDLDLVINMDNVVMYGKR